MAKVKIKTGKRKTSVSRTTVRNAIKSYRSAVTGVKVSASKKEINTHASKN